MENINDKIMNPSIPKQINMSMVPQSFVSLPKQYEPNNVATYLTTLNAKVSWMS